MFNPEIDFDTEEKFVTIIQNKINPLIGMDGADCSADVLYQF
jgi:Fe-S cluster biogenesis protein NfuA